MKHTILITNDDGVEGPGLKALVQGLHDEGHPIDVCVPERERSASTMHLTLHRPLKLRHRLDLLENYSLIDGGADLRIFDVSGYPADCVLAALGGGLPPSTPSPSLCVSGINRGPNMSVDILHSGTIGGARQAGTCGLPAIATSLDSFEENDYQGAVDATIGIIREMCKIIPAVPVNMGRVDGSYSKPTGDDADEILRDALKKGDIFLNLNVPVDWQGEYSSTHLGGRWYRQPIEILEGDDKEWMFKLGAAHIEDEPIEHGDSHCVRLGKASVSTLGTWPQGHPLAISDALMEETITDSGLPSWLISS